MALEIPKVARKNKEMESSQIVYELEANPIDWLAVNMIDRHPQKLFGSRLKRLLPPAESKVIVTEVILPIAVAPPAQSHLSEPVTATATKLPIPATTPLVSPDLTRALASVL